MQQFQYLADKYAPASPEIAETLAKLQLPPHTSVDQTSPVPLLNRAQPNSQHQIALVIRDGRRVASQLVSIGEASKTTGGSSRDTLSHTSQIETSMSTALEQDFTVEGKKGNLHCPFSRAAAAAAGDDSAPDQVDGVRPETLYDSDDPICAAMFDEANSQPGTANSAAAKCPIRFMDKHSPEEIAQYVETHKHELPRSHEVCVRRYQRNEEQIRKLDAKYGNLASMIQDLSHLHQPMLPEGAEGERSHHPSDVERASNERVENWAQAVTTETDAEVEPDEAEADQVEHGDEERQSHFNRDLKEVRVGESPSRPWGISVPVYEPSGHDDPEPFSPPPAPVRMPSPVPSNQAPRKTPGKCPFDHTKMAGFAGLAPPHKLDAKEPLRPERAPAPSERMPSEPPFTPIKEAAPPRSPPSQPQLQHQPTFINPDMAKGGPNSPQMVFTGPVFIGYPMDQAIQFMNQYRGGQ